MAQRNLYLSNVSVEEARERFLNALKPHMPSGEQIQVVDALDRVTYKAVFAQCNSPLYDSAAMDGIAVVSERTYLARESHPVDLCAGKDFIPVDTGDPVRPPYDAVIMAEDIQELENGKVRIRAAASPWQHIRPVGEDIVQGEMILPGSHIIRPVDIGALLSGGVTTVEVICRPRVAIFPTGTEMLEPGEPFREGGIVESNSRMLEALVRKGGGVPQRFPPLADDYSLLREKIGEAVPQYDVVLINAGSSAGTEDYTVHVLRELGEVLVHGVAMKPGKPVILAIVEGKPVIGIPGYPVSAYLAYENFAAPVLAFLTGNRPEKTTEVEAVLTRRLVSSLKHREYVRVKVGRVGDRLVASPLARGAGAAMSLVRADGFCVIGQESEGEEAGQTVRVELHRSLSQLDSTIVSIGSHDLILDVLADFLPNRYGAYLSSAHVGSMAGLLALEKGEAHIAPTHLLDEETGEYNVSVIKKLFREWPMALIKCVGRTQGIMVARGNPLQVRGVEDLPGLRYINRQRGAGTRILLDYKLKQAGISADSITGYHREGATHMAVAAAVKQGSADAGMGVLSAAKAMDLDFIPVGQEEYDFAIPQEFLELPPIRALLEALKSNGFQEILRDLGGYTWDHCGEVVLL